MIDREARNAVAAALEDYQRERITAFEFDERIFDVADKSRDQTVRECVDALWGFYDDCTDHRVVAEKHEWDVWERLRLLLLSDAELEVERHAGRWQWLKSLWELKWPLGVMVLLWWAWHSCGARFAIGLYLLLCAVATWWIRRNRVVVKGEDVPDRMAPFASLAQMRRALREVTGFRKRPYPRRLIGRVVPRSWLSEVAVQVFGFLWAPLLLGMVVTEAGASETVRVVWGK